MIDRRKAYEAALTLRKYCKQHGTDCDKCIFRFVFRSWVFGEAHECRLGAIDTVVPQIWNLDGVGKRAKREEYGNDAHEHDG